MNPADFFDEHDAETVEYRYGSAWRTGRLVGVWEGAEVMLVVRPGIGSEDEAVAYRMTDGWEKAVRWGRYLGVPDYFVPVKPDCVRMPESLEKRYMSRTPHACQKCGKPALVMTTKVSCTGRGCPDYDPRA